jgi:uncharacterized protein DUF4129
MSEALGFGISRGRTARRKKNNTLQILVYLAAWGVAIMVLMLRCGTILSAVQCNSTNAIQNAAAAVQNTVSPGQLPQLPILGPALALASLVDSNLFIIVFYGLVIISGVIMVRAYKVSWNERNSGQLETHQILQEGQEAVQDAIRILDEEESSDPRTRIIACYQRMIRATMALGAPMGPDRTARELERGIREMFMLKGSGIARLTELFEVARYSLHTVSEEDAEKARECLVEIRQELDGTANASREDASNAPRLSA